MTLEEIRELISVVTETGIAELEVQRGDNRVRIRRAVRHVQEFTAPARPHAAVPESAQSDDAASANNPAATQKVPPAPLLPPIHSATPAWSP